MSAFWLAVGIVGVLALIGSIAMDEYDRRREQR